MPAVSYQEQTTGNHFLGLHSYTEAQSKSFFGRDNETEALTSLIQNFIA
jgi:hypothetical protein